MDLIKAVKVLEKELSRLNTFKSHNKAHGLSISDIESNIVIIETAIIKVRGDNVSDTESKCNKHIVTRSFSEADVKSAWLDGKMDYTMDRDFDIENYG